MKPLKVLTGTIKSLRNLYLHILLTEEDGVVVARCLDFSVSSHGDNEEDALASLSDSIKGDKSFPVKTHGMKTMILSYALNWIN